MLTDASCWLVDCVFNKVIELTGLAAEIVLVCCVFDVADTVPGLTSSDNVSALLFVSSSISTWRGARTEG